MSRPMKRVIPDRRHVIPDSIRDPVTYPSISYLQHTGFRLSPE